MLLFQIPRHAVRSVAVGFSIIACVLAGASAAGTAKPPGGETLRRQFVREYLHPKVDAKPRCWGYASRNGLTYERWRIHTDPNEDTPLLMVRPDDHATPRPVVIALHGLGGNKEGLTAYLEEFARRGFVGVAIDARFHGERGGDLQAAMIESFHSGDGRPYIGDTVSDVWRVMDYLDTRKEVAAGRYGIMGISLGGHTTWMVSADPRVRVAVPCIAACSWKWQLRERGYMQRARNIGRAMEAVRHAKGEPDISPRVMAAAWERWLPGIPQRYDCQEMLAAFAPRPLLLVNGDSDPVAPLPGLKEAWSVIEPAYERQGGSARVQLNLAERTGHTITRAQRSAIFDWFSTWLR